MPAYFAFDASRFLSARCHILRLSRCRLCAAAFTPMMLTPPTLIFQRRFRFDYRHADDIAVTPFRIHCRALISLTPLLFAYADSYATIAFAAAAATFLRAIDFAIDCRRSSLPSLLLSYFAAHLMLLRSSDFTAMFQYRLPSFRHYYFAFISAFSSFQQIFRRFSP